MSTVDVLERLERVRPTRADAWAAACPAHDDRVTSLSVAIGDEGRLLFYCHAGCTTGDVVAALGLELVDLFERPPEPFVTTGALRLRMPVLGRTRDLPREQARLSITESHVTSWALRLWNNGPALARLHALKGWSPQTLSAMQIGFDGRRITFPVRGPDGELRGALRYLPGGEPKMLATSGTPRSLFPAPELFAPMAPLWLVEGEPDAVSARELGLPAIGLPGVGSWARHAHEWIPRFSGRRVVVLMDCDGPGRETASRIAIDLSSTAEVKVLGLDFSRDDGHDLGDELAVAAAAGELAVRRLRRWLVERSGFGVSAGERVSGGAW